MLQRHADPRLHARTYLEFSIAGPHAAVCKHAADAADARRQPRGREGCKAAAARVAADVQQTFAGAAEVGAQHLRALCVSCVVFSVMVTVQQTDNRRGSEFTCQIQHPPRQLTVSTSCHVLSGLLHAANYTTKDIENKRALRS